MSENWLCPWLDKSTTRIIVGPTEDSDNPDNPLVSAVAKHPITTEEKPSYDFILPPPNENVSPLQKNKTPKISVI